MTRRRATLVASTGLALVAALLAAPAGAQEAASGTLDITPTSGPAGTAVTVSGEDCAPAQAFNAFVQIYFVDATHVLSAVEAGIADNGGWSTQIQVPTGLDPNGTYTVFATCFVDSGETVATDSAYEQVAFDVTVDPAAVAAPQPGDPSFTG